MLISRAIHFEYDNVNLEKGTRETASNIVSLPTSILGRQTVQ